MSFTKPTGQTEDRSSRSQGQYGLYPQSSPAASWPQAAPGCSPGEREATGGLRVMGVTGGQGSLW